MQDTENLYMEIFNIFNNTHPHEGVTLYLKFAQKRLSGNLPTSGSIANAIFQFKQIEKMPFASSTIHNDSFYKACLQFQKSRNELKRNMLLLSFLGEMVCFWFMKDYNTVRVLQREVNKIEFNDTWWERNKKDIAGLGGALLGAATMLAGGGSAGMVGAGSAIGGRTLMENVSNDDSEKNRFYELRNAICSINFEGI